MHKNGRQEPLESLLLAPRMVSRQAQRAKPPSDTDPITKNHYFLWPVQPWGRLQTHQNRLQELPDAPKNRGAMSHAYQVHFFCKNIALQKGFWATTSLIFENKHMLMSSRAHLQFSEDVLCVLLVFGDRGHFVLAS